MSKSPIVADAHFYTRDILYVEKHPIVICITPFGELIPADDISAKESVLISMLLACGLRGSFDIESFVREHKLERHFSKPQRTGRGE